MIRPATPQDAPFVAELMFQAMEKITYILVDEENKEKAISLLLELFSMKNNQYSYENTLVYVECCVLILASMIAPFISTTIFTTILP